MKFDSSRLTFVPTNAHWINMLIHSSLYNCVGRGTGTKFWTFK